MGLIPCIIEKKIYKARSHAESESNEQVTEELKVCVDCKETGRTVQKAGLCYLLEKGFECQTTYLALLG